MTAIWGPLGWLTLHSTALAYPETPTPAEQQLMTSWLDMFRDTITCNYCRGHFTELLAKYRTMFPNMLGSRQEFVMFTFRAHNSVNRRLNKPVYQTVQESMDTLRKAVANRSALDYRVSYINHIMRYWQTQQDITGVVALKKVVQLKKIEIEYVGPRDTNFKIDIKEDVTMLPRDALERISSETQVATRPIALPTTRVGFRLTSTGFRLR
jgi:hypothetical protein